MLEASPAMINVLSVKLNQVLVQQVPLLQILVLQELDPQAISRHQIAHPRATSLNKTTHLLVLSLQKLTNTRQVMTFLKSISMSSNGITLAGLNQRKWQPSLKVL